MKFEKIKKGDIIQVGTENFYFLKKHEMVFLKHSLKREERPHLHLSILFLKMQNFTHQKRIPSIFYEVN